MRRRAATLVRVALAVTLIGACRDIDAPASPTAVRVATTIGQIVEAGPGSWSYRLAGGELVDVGGTGSSAPPMARLSRALPQPPSSDHVGGLLLVGRDAAGPFYAATDVPKADGCFEIHGAGYLEPGQIHYSTGLVLPLDANVTVTNERGTHPATWLLEADAVCLDASGLVTSIHQLPLGV